MGERAIVQQVMEKQQRLQELLLLISEAISKPSATEVVDWFETLRDRFERLRAHLHLVIALEEHGGFLAPVIERRPTLAPQVELIKAKHHEQLVLASEIHNALQRLSAEDRLALEECQRRIRLLISDVRYWGEAKALLVTSVFCRDLGGES